MSPRSGREACAPSPPPKCRGAEVLGGPASPAWARRGGHGLCLPLQPPGSAPPAGGRWLVPQRPAVRSRCSSGGDSHELGDARCLHDQAADARRSPAPLQRLPLLLGQGCAGRGSCQIDSSCGRVRAAPGRGDLWGAREGCQPLEVLVRLGSPALHSRRCHSGAGLCSGAVAASRGALRRL